MKQRKVNMNFWLKNIIPIILIIIALPRSVQAQQLQGAFIMSSVGSLQNMSNNSMSVTFSSNASCFNVHNGAAVIIGDRGIGTFAINCEVNTRFNTLGIKLYPNPVKAYTIIKFINTPPLDDLFNISIWSTEGYKITSDKATGYEIYQGKPIDFSKLNVGTYIIQIESEKYMDALKFIKAN